MAPEHILRKGRIEPNDARCLEDGEPLPDTPTDTILCLSAARWKTWLEQGESPPPGLRLGLALHPADDVRTLRAVLPHVALVSVFFPKFGDGRGYSQARLLREELGWTGELRARGDVLQDQANYLHRCGIDAWEPHDPRQLERLPRGIGDFRMTYQPIPGVEGAMGVGRPG
jgi:uncharacterized protein (DUF934 family)